MRPTALNVEGASVSKPGHIEVKVLVASVVVSIYPYKTVWRIENARHNPTPPIASPSEGKKDQ
jgi:hypothetical protein